MANKEEEKTSGKVRFRDQCYLLWNLSSFASANANTVYDNMTVISGDPSDVVNKLVSKPGMDRLFNLKPVENSALVPMIRLFKTTYGDSEKTEEIKFNTVLSKQSIDSITSTRFGRGDGIGIKSVSFDLQGGSTTGGAALVKKGVTQVEITFLFQNLEMLIQGEGDSPRLIDLVTFPPSETNVPAPKCAEGSPIDFTNVFDAGKFAIKLVYGYAVPESSLIDQELKEVIENSTTTLLLNLQRHELDFKQDGTVELKCQYMGYADSMMSRPESDIFFINEERDPNINERTRDLQSVTKRLNQAKEEKNRATAKEDIDDLDEQITTLEEELQELENAQKEQGENDRVFAYQRILSEIYNSGKVFFVDLNEEQVNQHLIEVFNEEPQPPDFVEGFDDIDTAQWWLDNSLIVQGAKALLEEESEEAQNSSGTTIPNPQQANIEDLKTEGYNDAEDVFQETELAGVQETFANLAQTNSSTRKKGAGDVRVNFIYYGDLLNIAFGVLNKNPQASTLRPMLGPIVYNDPKSGQSTKINLADVPISLNKFVEWFNKNVVSQAREEYLLKDFIRDTVKDLIHAALGEGCFPASGYPAPEPNITVATIPIAKQGGTSLIPAKSRVDIANIPRQKSLHYKDANKIDQYVYVYCYTFGLSGLEGDRNADHQKGIYHLQIGANSGLVKKVAFSRIDDPYLAASRATAVKCDLRHLRENYKVTISMIGNSLFRPGQTVYINPTLAGGSSPQDTALVAEKLGLGGYYTVTKVSGELSPSGFGVEVEAIWESPKISRQAGIQAISSGSPSNGGFANTGDGEKGAKNPSEPEIDATPATYGAADRSLLI